MNISAASVTQAKIRGYRNTDSESCVRVLLIVVVVVADVVVVVLVVVFDVEVIVVL